MADYYTQFVEKIPQLTQVEWDWCDLVLKQDFKDEADAEAWAKELRLEKEIEEDGFIDWWPSFSYSFVTNTDGSVDLVLYSDESFIEQQLIAFVQAFLRRFRPTDCWGVTMADTCSANRVGAFGGCWLLITARGVRGGSCADQLAQARCERENSLKKGKRKCRNKNVK